MGTFGTVRIYELARSLGMSTDDVVEKLRAIGEDVTSASSSVHASVAATFTAKMRALTRPAPTTVVRRRAPEPVAVPAPAPEAPVVVPEPEPLELYDMRTRFERQLAAARSRNQR